MGRVVRPFTVQEAGIVQEQLEDLVRALRIVPGGGKIEEGYWNYIYCTVRNAPVGGWSNRTMRDYCHNGTGVEMKLLKKRSPSSCQGRPLMHPSATRAIVFDPAEGEEESKRKVLTQFGDHIKDFRERVRQTCGERDPLIRWGVLLWSPTLDEFLYFEEEMVEPDPKDYYAKIEKGNHRGKETKNLYIYENDTNVKRYAVTMPRNGAKIQPYFDIPKEEQGAYLFKVPDDSRAPLWLPSETIEALKSAANGEDLNAVVLAALQAFHEKRSKQAV